MRVSRSYGCVRVGPYCTVRGVTSIRPGQESREPRVEWLTPNPFDGMQPVFREQGSPWHVTPHWAEVNGKAMMVGLDIRSFTSPWVKDPDDPLDDGHEGPREPADPSLGFAELTQAVLRGVSISAVRSESAAYLAHALGAISAQVDAAFGPGTALGVHTGEVASQLTQGGRPRKRRPPASGELLAQVAAYYNEAVALGSRTPVKYAEDRLSAAGAPVSTRGGRVQVRKWVQRARQKGLIPPA
jgi:hypothetical protein